MADFKDSIKNFINDRVDAFKQNAEGFVDKAFLNVRQETFRAGGPAKGTYYNDKYRPKTYQYPSDLFSNSGIYGDNYVVFYINIPSDSRLLKQPGVETTVADTTSLRGPVATANYNAAQVAGSAVAAGTGVGALFGLGNVGAVGGGVMGGAAVTTAAGKPLTPEEMLTTPLRQQRRLLETITLNVPNNLTVRYGMNYSEEDMFGMAAMADTGEDLAKFAKEAAGGTARNAGGAAGDTATGVTNIAAGLGFMTPGVGGFLSAATGMAANPKKEQIFKSVDFRTFSFEYQFAPRNAKEAEEVKNIIKTFKLHMHPEYKDANGYLLLYPSEFDIFYYQGREENMNLPRHTSCVLTEMSVNYTPNNQFNTFSDGSATQINVNLVFKELAFLTKDQILDGF